MSQTNQKHTKTKLTAIVIQNTMLQLMGIHELRYIVEADSEEELIDAYAEIMEQVHYLVKNRNRVGGER